MSDFLNMDGIARNHAYLIFSDLYAAVRGRHELLSRIDRDSEREYIISVARNIAPAASQSISSKKIALNDAIACISSFASAFEDHDISLFASYFFGDCLIRVKGLFNGYRGFDSYVLGYLLSIYDIVNIDVVPDGREEYAALFIEHLIDLAEGQRAGADGIEVIECETVSKYVVSLRDSDRRKAEDMKSLYDSLSSERKLAAVSIGETINEYICSGDLRGLRVFLGGTGTEFQYMNESEIALCAHQIDVMTAEPVLLSSEEVSGGKVSVGSDVVFNYLCYLLEGHYISSERMAAVRHGLGQEGVFALVLEIIAKQRAEAILDVLMSDMDYQFVFRANTKSLLDCERVYFDEAVVIYADNWFIKELLCNKRVTKDMLSRYCEMICVGSQELIEESAFSVFLAIVSWNDELRVRMNGYEWVDSASLSVLQSIALSRLQGADAKAIESLSNALLGSINGINVVSEDHVAQKEIFSWEYDVTLDEAIIGSIKMIRSDEVIAEEFVRVKSVCDEIDRLREERINTLSRVNTEKTDAVADKFIDAIVSDRSAFDVQIGFLSSFVRVYSDDEVVAIAERLRERITEIMKAFPEVFSPEQMIFVIVNGLADISGLDVSKIDSFISGINGYAAAVDGSDVRDAVARKRTQRKSLRLVR